MPETWQVQFVDENITFATEDEMAGPTW